jgi:hypothetical protein
MAQPNGAGTRSPLELELTEPSLFFTHGPRYAPSGPRRRSMRPSPRA